MDTSRAILICPNTTACEVMNLILIYNAEQSTYHQKKFYFWPHQSYMQRDIFVGRGTRIADYMNVSEQDWYNTDPHVWTAWARSNYIQGIEVVDFFTNLKKKYNLEARRCSRVTLITAGPYSGKNLHYNVMPKLRVRWNKSLRVRKRPTVVFRLHNNRASRWSRRGELISAS